MVEPAVFLLDEPTANLAPQVAAGPLGYPRALAEAGAAVLAISDYTYVLGGGQVLMADTPAHLSASQEFTGTRRRADLIGPIQHRSGPPGAVDYRGTSARSSTDRASDYGSEGWGFESLRARKRIRRPGLYLELSGRSSEH